MVNITRGRKFIFHFRERVSPNKELVKLYQEQVKLFIEDRNDPALDDHPLSGKLQGSRAFYITNDIRVVYVERGKNEFVFLNIGTHKQVYGNS
jgi:addiction module RelE/StbE family toxin